MRWEYWVFLCFLLCASGQDLRKKAVDVRIYKLFGMISTVMALRQSVFPGGWQKTGDCLMGAAVGMVLLMISKASQNSIGAGDGWFFAVSGTLLGFWGNFLLLCSGIFCCGVFCLGYFVYGKCRNGEDVRSCTVPFLPFLAAPGIWLVLRELGG
ncbi:MAG: A24 family peptidase [Eubacteriales bacterium]|nr:A24 family peptidase [Eubacteriales bacterium]